MLPGLPMLIRTLGVQEIVRLFPYLGHYNVVGSAYVGNSQAIPQNSRTGLSNEDFTAIASAFMFSLVLVHWPGATEKALSFGDNEKLTPGHNDSKIYPGDIEVEYSEIPIPDTSPQVQCSFPHLICLLRTCLFRLPSSLLCYT